jgi:hypothetical protein
VNTEEQSDCLDEVATCNMNNNCVVEWNCIVDCGVGNTTCISQCKSSVGNVAHAQYGALVTCVCDACDCAATLAPCAP